MLKINVKSDTKKLEKDLNMLIKHRHPAMVATGINLTAKGLQAKLTTEIAKSFDRPMKQTLRGVFMVKATKKRLDALVGLKDFVAEYLQYSITPQIRKQRKDIAVPLYKNAGTFNQYGNVKPRKRNRGVFVDPTRQAFIKTKSGQTAIIKKTGRGKSRTSILQFVMKPFVRYDNQLFPFFNISKRYVNKHIQRNLQRARRFNLTRSL